LPVISQVIKESRTSKEDLVYLTEEKGSAYEQIEPLLSSFANGV
jgi:hypothetical protein